MVFCDGKNAAMGYSGLGGTSFMNPAGISFYTNTVAFISYGNRFMLKDLSEMKAGIIYPNKVLDTACLYSRLGNDYYNENLLGIIVSKKLFASLSLSVLFNYFFIQTDNPEESRYFSTDISFRWRLRNDLSIGCLLPGFLKTKSLTRREYFTYLLAGLTYHLNKDFILNTDVEITRKEIYYKIGVSYKPVENLFFRLGTFGKPFIPTFGIGYSFLSVTCDIALINHNILGITPEVSLSYSF